jgi:tryptophan-rich sensory protein
MLKLKLKQDWPRLFAPMVLGFVVSRLCPDAGRSDAAEAVLPAQPPGWVFGVVWPVLYLCIGVVWVLSKRSGVKGVDTLFLVNMICINAWIWFYGCKKDKRAGLWTFVPSIATAMVMMMLVFYATHQRYGWWPAALVAPYVAWLIFASQLNFARVV